VIHILINGNRALAYTTYVLNIEPINGADNIELLTVLGWKVIAKKGEFKVGDLCVYFEIDSKLPEAPWSEFMASKHYKVKTMKLSKFGVTSQGLALPLSVFGVEMPTTEGVDCTELLKVKYSVEEDNKRKNTNPNAKYDSMKSRHKQLFKKPWAKWMMKRSWGRKVMFFFFGKKKDNPRGFPTFVSKTDEERVENQPWRIGDGKEYLCTEKLDGTSCTYALERKRGNKFEFYVCSRNVRQQDENQQTYHDHNIYWDLAFKYNIEEHLKAYLQVHPECKWVCIQGEGVGTVQGNPLKLKEDDLYVFNFKDSVRGRFSSADGRAIVEDDWGMKWVPIIGIVKKLIIQSNILLAVTDNSNRTWSVGHGTAKHTM
jgi:hypothetical protein